MPKRTLSQKKDILDLLKSGKKHCYRNLVFYWKEKQNGRIAISCSKQVFKLAVQRNAFKRKNRALCQSAFKDTNHLDLLVCASKGLSKTPKENIKLVIQRAWTSFLHQLNTV